MILGERNITKAKKDTIEEGGVPPRKERIEDIVKGFHGGAIGTNGGIIGDGRLHPPCGTFTISFRAGMQILVIIGYFLKVLIYFNEFSLKLRF